MQPLACLTEEAVSLFGSQLVGLLAYLDHAISDDLEVLLHLGTVYVSPCLAVPHLRKAMCSGGAIGSCHSPCVLLCLHWAWEHLFNNLYLNQEMQLGNII